MIQATKPHADDKDYGQSQGSREVRGRLPSVKRDHEAARAFHYDDISHAAQLPVRICDGIDLDLDRIEFRRDVRCNRGLESIGVNELARSLLRSCDAQFFDVFPTVTLAARCNWLHANGGSSSRCESPEQSAGDQRLAYAGVRTGNEE
jgi:hypothetical protein